MNHTRRLGAPVALAALVLALALPATASAARNPFGAQIGAINDGIRMNVANALGADYIRTHVAIVLDQWSGSCAECDAAHQNGKELVLTVRAHQSGAPVPAGAPMNAYRQDLAQALVATQPEVLIVENEQDNPNFYTGDPAQYQSQLSAACQTAHFYGIKCADGGLSSWTMRSMIYQDFLDNGPAGAALAFAGAVANTDNEYETLTTTNAAQVFLREQRAAEGRDFLDGYLPAGADYVNFHWYQHNAGSFRTAVTWLGQKSGGMRPISNETGMRLHNNDAEIWRIETQNPGVSDIEGKVVADIMDATMDLCLPYLSWFSIDNDNEGTSNDTYALNSLTGALRPGGNAYADYVADSVPDAPACPAP